MNETRQTRDHTGNSTGPVRRWDLPSRVSHWGFAFSFGGSLWIGFRCDPEGSIFKFHFLAAVLALWFLGVRVVLGLWGVRAIRWRFFWHCPRSLWRYLCGVAAWKRMEFDGLNPGTSFFALGLYLGLGGLIWSGFEGSWGEVWHGRLAWFALGLIVCHLLGLILHALRHGGGALGAMLHGREHREMESSSVAFNGFAGGMWLLLSLVVAWVLLRYFDETTGILAVPGLPEIAFPLVQKG